MLENISVRPITLRGQVVDRLKAAMMSGELPPGFRMNERTLCEKLGVSRTLLREAMRSLESQGLVASTPHKGVVVATLGRKETIDHYATRGALEGLLVREFVRRADAPMMKRLRDVVSEIDAQNRNFSLPQYVRLKAEFYDTLMQGADNPVAADVLRIIHARVAQLWATSLSRDGRAEKSVKEISSMVEAIEARDEQRAFDLCMSHNASALQNTLAVLDGAAEHSGAVKTRVST